MKSAKGFLIMTISFVGIVVFSSIFLNIMEQLVSIANYANLSTFLVMSIIVQITPAILLISSLLVARWGYNKGEMIASASDTGGILRMVYGAIGLILFFALFVVFLPYMYYIYIGGTTANATYDPTEFIALTTIASIIPAVLFIGGVFMTGRTAVRGYRARKSRSRAMLS